MTKKNLGNKGQIATATVFLIATFALILFFTVIAPLSQKINLESYKSAEVTMSSAILSANSIQDQNVRTSVLSIYQSEKDSFVGQTEIVGTFVKYGWFFIILVVLFGLFLVTRKNVEAQGGVA